MGLLKRAASLCLILQNNNKITAHPTDTPNKKNGIHSLLKKALSLIDKGVSSPPPPLFWEIKKRSPAKTGMNKQVSEYFTPSSPALEDITYPYSLFMQIKEFFNLSSAALFLFSRLQGSYLPWVFCGPEQDKIDRLHFSEPSASLFSRLAGGATYLTGEEFPAVFSGKGHSLARVLIAPFIHKEKLLAFLLIFNPDEKSAGMGGDLRLLDNICELTAPLIRQKREKMLGAYSSLYTRNGRSRKEAAMALYRDCKTERLPLYLMVTSFKKIIDKIREKNEFIRPQCLLDDMALLVNSLLNGIGLALPISDKRIIIFFKGYPSLAPQLLLHQVFLQLKSIYHDFSEYWEINLPIRPETTLEEEKDFNSILEDYL